MSNSFISPLDDDAIKGVCGDRKGNKGKNAAQERDDTHTSWHPAFVEAIKLELDQYGDMLEYTPEYQLTREPLRIDVVIVKKRKNVPIKKNIAAIFRGHNLIEYKSPTDYISLEDFYKVYAYACLYVTAEPKTAEADLTITFVGSRYPRKLAEHLERFRHCVVERTSPGVYSVKGDPIPIQIIDIRELPEGENLWLAKLDNRLDQNEAWKVLSELNRLDKADHVGAYIEALYNANFAVMEEASKMFDVKAVLNTPWEEAGYVTRKMILAAAEAAEKTKLETEAKVKAESNAKIVKNALAQGIALETVAAITELEIEKVREIAGLGNRPVN
jgi:hypothetical protein